MRWIVAECGPCLRVIDPSARLWKGPLTIREVARRVGRDVKAVHGDVHALMNAGLLERSETSRVAFPFDAIRVEFTLRAA